MIERCNILYPKTIDKKSNKCCTEENLEYFDGGDGVEWETWECQKCFNLYVVTIEITRYFDQIELIKQERI